MHESNPRIPYEMMTERKPLAPLEGKSLIVHVVMNVEYWPFDKPMPRTVMPAPHGQSPVPDVPNFSWAEYGMRVGLPRLLGMLSDRGLRASAFINAYCCDIYASAAEAMLKAEWEFVGHGWIQRSLRQEDDEAEVIEKSIARLEAFTGQKVRGWLGPGLGETFDTPDILKERGLDWLADFCVDDLPCWMRTKYGPLVGLPYTVEMNDSPITAVEKQSSDEMLRRLEQTLPVFEREMARNPKVLTIALHPHLTGPAHRAYFFEKMLDLLVARDDTIFVTGSEICDWFMAADGTDGAAVARPSVRSVRRAPPRRARA